MPEQGGLDRTTIQPILPGKPPMDDDVNGWLESIWKYLVAQQFTLADMFDVLAQKANELPEMIWIGFFQDNVAANQTDVVLSNGRSTRGWTAGEDGSVTAIAVKSNEARTAGQLDVEITINGAKTGLKATLDANNTTSHGTLQDQGLSTFTKYSDSIGVVITTDASWEPTTADIDVTVGIVPARGVR